jgi:PAS domain S-box-containing protein
MQTQLSPDAKQAIERLAEQNGLTMSQLIQQLQSDYRTPDYRRRFFDLSLDLFCVVNYDGIIQHVNPAFINTTGYPESALVGQEVMDFYHADDLEHATQSARALRNGEQLQSLDLRFRIADGSYRWLNCTARPEADDLIYVTARDITETITLRERVEARNRRISNIMTNISDAFFAIDREWRFIYLNPEAERALQRTREELIGQNIWDEFPQAVNGPFYTHYQRVMHEGDVGDFVAYYPPLAAWFDVRAYPIPEGIAVYFHDVTEQMHTEQETQRQKLHIEMALDAANMGVWTWDVAQDQIQWSPEVLKIFGVDENSTDLDQAQYMSFIHPDDVETFQAALDAVLKDPDNNFYTTVHRIMTPTNTERWIYGEGKLYHDENGDPSFLLGIVKDITEQKKTKDALRESEERYRKVVTAMAEGIVVHRLDGTIKTANQQACAILGLTYDQLVGRTSLDPRWRSVHEDGRPFPGEMHPAMVTLRTGESQHNTIMGVHKPNGTLSWISINSEPILDADTQELQGAIASFNDITQRKIIQEQIIASEKRFRRLVESAPVGILLINIQGQIITANPMIGRIFGYSTEQLQQFTVEDLIPHDRRHTHIGLRHSYHKIDDSRLMAKGIHVEGLRADGTLVPLEVALNNVIIDDERVTIAFVSDITLRQQAEAMERETTTLRLKLEKEKELNELKNSFITIVSHEFRTPMTIIMSSVALLRRYGDRLSVEKRKQRLAKIDTQIQRLTVMMDEIVRISQDDAESYQVRPEVLQINDFISQILEELHVQHEKDFQALVNHHHNTMTIYEDDALLHQICLNIISNAVKYSPDQSIITIETRMTPDTWTFSVRDRGIGIPTADQEKLFTLFHRGSNVDNIAGTGLGLVIVQQAVERLNGHIHFESTEGEGTTFTVILPRRPYDFA